MANKKSVILQGNIASKDIRIPGCDFDEKSLSTAVT